jgi:hypothetical protein
MPDKEKVIKGLECAIGIRGIKNCDDCPYDNDFNCIGCDIVMRDAIALLKEQEAVVRCKDCKHYMTIHCNCGGCFISDDWYCADGERR